MRITYKGDYALKAMLELALNYENGSILTIHELARRLDIPFKFLEQVLLDLKRGGFVESRRGKIGGYLLARPPVRIKLGEVVRFIDGPLEPIACVEKNYHGCKDIYNCIFRRVWEDVAKATTKIIDGVTFEDLVLELKLKEQRLVYAI